MTDLGCVWWAGLGGRVVVRRWFVMVKQRRVGQVRWGVAGRLNVALRLLEGPSGVGLPARHLGAAFTQRTLVVALEKRRRAPG